MTLEGEHAAERPKLRMLEGEGRHVGRVACWTGFAFIELGEKTELHRATVRSLLDLLADRTAGIKPDGPCVEIVYGVIGDSEEERVHDSKTTIQKILAHLSVGDEALVRHVVLPPDPEPVMLRELQD